MTMMADTFSAHLEPKPTVSGSSPGCSGGDFEGAGLPSPWVLVGSRGFLAPASLHLLLHLVALVVGSRLHLQGLAAAAADVPEEAQVGAARHRHRHQDDDGGAEGG